MRFKSSNLGFPAVGEKETSYITLGPVLKNFCGRNYCWIARMFLSVNHFHPSQIFAQKIGMTLAFYDTDIITTVKVLQYRPMVFQQDYCFSC